MLPRPLKQQVGVNIVKFTASQSDVHPFGSEWMHFRYQNLILPTGNFISFSFTTCKITTNKVLSRHQFSSNIKSQYVCILTC